MIASQGRTRRDYDERGQIRKRQCIGAAVFLRFHPLLTLTSRSIGHRDNGAIEESTQVAASKSTRLPTGLSSRLSATDHTPPFQATVEAMQMPRLSVVGWSRHHLTGRRRMASSPKTTTTTTTPFVECAFLWPWLIDPRTQRCVWWTRR